MSGKRNELTAQLHAYDDKMRRKKKQQKLQQNQQHIFMAVYVPLLRPIVCYNNFFSFSNEFVRHCRQAIANVTPFHVFSSTFHFFPYSNGSFWSEVCVCVCVCFVCQKQYIVTELFT